ncbi:hypothetical protein WMY93_018508 [Mugilogobius chulae]|uniref:BED-type domain-containing protein n=1 Tax=Mugilogobius chulae TaxID=88201 RepID=A0AAW0NQJ8_9GOBI
MEGGVQPAKRVRSYVWEHFDLMSPTQVKCLKCGQELAYCNNTSSMVRHLRRKHPETNPEAVAAACAPGAASQQGRQSELDEALLEMIVMDLQAFKIVESPGFRKFVHKLNSDYVLPTRQAVKSMLEDKYKDVQEQTKAHLENVQAVSLTADMWTSMNMDAYLGVTCHFLNDMTLESVLLGVGHFGVSHTAENIKDAMVVQLEKWGLSQKVKCLITDSASNMLLSAKLLGVANVPCYAHILNLLVKKALDQTPPLAEIRTKARKIVTVFKTSVKAKEKLTEVQEQLQKPKHKLLQEVDTRWNSTYLMLERLFEQREPVAAALASLSSETPPLSTMDYDIIYESLGVLGPINLASNELSAEKTVSASKIIPITRMIQHKLAQRAVTLVQPAAVALCQNLQQLFSVKCNGETVSILAMATLLDPRFKTLAFGNQTHAQEAVKRLTAECSKNIGAERAPPGPLQEEAGLAEAEEGDSLWDFLDCRVGATQGTNSCTADATVEVQRYLSEAYLSRGEDPLKYWESRKDIYPHLHRLAKDYLHIPATSVPCERVFSKAGEVVRLKRKVDNNPDTLDTIHVGPEQGLGPKILGFFKQRPIINETFNFIRGLSLHQNYSQYDNFLSWKDSHPDAFPNQLTPSDPTLHLIDSGHSINIGCPPVLRPERHVDVIIVLSYSWDPDNVFKVLEKTSEFCEEHKVDFPSADYKDLKKQPQREVYVFEDPQNPKAPIVLLLPLVNASYKEYKAPGAKRQTEEELAAGQVDVSSSNSPYTTKNMTYSESDYDALIDLTCYNVLQSKDSHEPTTPVKTRHNNDPKTRAKRRQDTTTRSHEPTTPVKTRHNNDPKTRAKRRQDTTTRVKRRHRHDDSREKKTQRHDQASECPRFPRHLNVTRAPFIQREPVSAPRRVTLQPTRVILLLRRFYSQYSGAKTTLSRRFDSPAPALINHAPCSPKPRPLVPVLPPSPQSNSLSSASAGLKAQLVVSGLSNSTFSSFQIQLPSPRKREKKTLRIPGRLK